MADIAAKVAQIRQAIFGKDVRESIASGIEAINNEVTNTTSRQNVIDSQEQSRIDAEKIRQSQEATRQSQEGIRQSQEATRQNQESIRINAENIRQTTFDINEKSRDTTFSTNESIRVQNETDRVNEFNGLKAAINTSIDNANTATTNTNQATSNYMSVVEQTRKIYKPSVGTFSDLSTTYPTPEIGYTVVTRDTNIEYRWDGVEWMSIGIGDSSIGYNIVVGSIAPDNPKTIWLEAPGDTKYARIVPSVTQPTDLGQIWWEMDE
jgi:hypothetical protein